MTLLEIEILSHYYCRSGDYREGDYSAPAVREAIDRFRDVEGLLRNTTPEEQRRQPWGKGACYALTERGRVFVEAIQQVPLPVQVWIMPQAA